MSLTQAIREALARNLRFVCRAKSERTYYALSGVPMGDHWVTYELDCYGTPHLVRREG